jgi:hypothetical protein
MRVAALLAAGVGALVLVAPASAEFTPEPVLTTTASEVEPSPGDGFFAWSQASAAHPNRYNVFFAPTTAEGKPNVANRRRVNPDGTIGFAGDMDGTTLVYGQRPGLSQPGGVRFYNVAGRTFMPTPDGVNTRRGHEAGPKLSADWLLFARYGRSRQSIYLWDRAGTATRRLDMLAYPGYLQTGGVAGNWAVWTRCRRWAHCNTYRWNITAQRRMHVRNPLSRSQYAASVSEDGAVYYGESANIFCGRNLAIWRDPPGAGPRERLRSIPSGRDIAVTSPVVLPDTSVDVYYDQYNCDNGRANIYRINVPGP